MNYTVLKISGMWAVFHGLQKVREFYTEAAARTHEIAAAISA